MCILPALILAANGSFVSVLPKIVYGIVSARFPGPLSVYSTICSTGLAPGLYEAETDCTVDDG